jgi:short-subunit dehydrogenase/acyl carrier protein
MARAGVTVFVEIGPDGTLSAMGPAALADDAEAAFVPVQRPGQPAPQALVAALAQAYVRGVPVDWTAVLAGGRRVDLPTYAFQHQRFWPAPPQAPAVTAGWRYQVGWVPVPAAGPPVLAGRWLVVTPAGTPRPELAAGCVQAMTTAGAEVTHLQVPAGADRAAMAAAVAEAEPAGVVSLLAVAPEPGYPVVAPGLAGTLALMQGLGDAGIGAPLWVLTCGAVAAETGDQVASPVQAQVWGLGRVAALEHPDRWGGLADLPQVWDERAGTQLGQVLAGCGEDQVAIRPAAIMARRLARAPQPENGQRWAPRGTVLVTGGTGAIGGQVARLAAGRGAPRLVLASRSGAAADGAPVLAATLAAAGTAVEVTACDLADRGELAGLLARIAVDGPPLSTVMHTAGARQSIAIEEVTTADLAEVAAAKAGGAALLDELTADLDLDAFVLFSSISSTWGSGLQPGYAAANAFLDALAEHRRARGLAATSVAWGLWGGDGMASGEDGVQLQRRGLRAMPPESAVQALSQALDDGEGLVTVADVDWARFAPAFTLRRPSPLLRDLPAVAQALAEAARDGASAAAGATPGGGELGQRLAGLPRAEQDRLLTVLVRAEAAAVLGHPSAEAVEPDQAFKDLGFDSLTAVELRNRLNAVTGLRLPATLVFDYPSPMALAGYLRAETLPAETAHLPAMEELDRLESLLSSIAGDGEERRRVGARLEAIVQDFRDAALDDADNGRELDEATDDEMFSVVEKELGIDELD